MDQFCVFGNHGVKFGLNWIPFDPSPLIKSPLETHVYAYKWLKNIGIAIKFGMNVYFVNINHVILYGWSIIAPRSTIGPLKKIYLPIMIGLKTVLPR